MIFGRLLQDVAENKSTGNASRKHIAFILRRPERSRNRTGRQAALRLVGVAFAAGAISWDRNWCSGPNMIGQSERFNILESVPQNGLGAFCAFQVRRLPALKRFFAGRFGKRRTHEPNVGDDLVLVFPRQRKRPDNVALLYSPFSALRSRGRLFY
jgi:hypothetical protein